MVKLAKSSEARGYAEIYSEWTDTMKGTMDTFVAEKSDSHGTLAALAGIANRQLVRLATVARTNAYDRGLFYVNEVCGVGMVIHAVSPLVERAALGVYWTTEGIKPLTGLVCRNSFFTSLVLKTLALHPDGKRSRRAVRKQHHVAFPTHVEHRSAERRERREESDIEAKPCFARSSGQHGRTSLR
jgi:hypothetical protein